MIVVFEMDDKGNTNLFWQKPPVNKINNLPLPVNANITMEIKRIFDLLDWMCEQYPKEDALAEKRNGVWIKISTQEYREKAHFLAYGLYELGVRKGDRIITITNNRPEWNYMDMALAMLGAVHVPVYPTLNTEANVHIFRHCEPSYLFVSNALQYKRVQPALKQLDNPPVLYSFDSISGVNYFGDIVKLGQENSEKNQAIVEEIKSGIKADDLCSMVYTSGTTGDSKGVMLSHRNLTSNFLAHSKHMPLNHENKMLSFLPLCHIYERSMNYHYQYKGISIYYAESIGTIADNMKEIHADGFCTVPRVLETIAGKVFAAGKKLPFFSRQVYQRAINHGYRWDYSGKSIWYNIWQKFYDKAVYSKWRDSLGGKHLTIISGGSALQQSYIRLFSAAGICVYEGYGMTESSPVIAVNNPVTRQCKIGTVGVVLSGTEAKISDEGEILTRGPHVMLGYYKDPEYTRQVIDADGWLHTGDIGEFVDGIYLKITDRKKEIFKLSAGKYVAPQPIENKLKESDFIEQAMVIGENEKFASAIIVPNFAELKSWSNRNRVHYRDDATLVDEDLVYKLYSKIIDELNRELSPHEQIKRFRLVADEWTQQNGFLSPTLKLRRVPLLKKYQSLIEEIYNKVETTQTRGMVFTQFIEEHKIASLEGKMLRLESKRKMLDLRRQERLLRLADRYQARIDKAEMRLASAKTPAQKQKLETKKERLEMRSQIREKKIQMRFARRFLRLDFRKSKFQLKIAFHEKRIAKKK